MNDPLGAPNACIYIYIYREREREREREMDGIGYVVMGPALISGKRLLNFTLSTSLIFFNNKIALFVMSFYYVVFVRIVS